MSPTRMKRPRKPFSPRNPGIDLGQRYRCAGVAVIEGRGVTLGIGEILGIGVMEGIAPVDGVVVTVGIGLAEGTGAILGVTWVGVTSDGVESVVSLARLHPHRGKTKAALRLR